MIRTCRSSFRQLVNSLPSCALVLSGIPLSGSRNILSAVLCEHVTLVCKWIAGGGGGEGRGGVVVRRLDTVLSSIRVNKD